MSKYFKSHKRRKLLILSTVITLLLVGMPVKAAVTVDDMKNPIMNKETHTREDGVSGIHETRYSYVYFGMYPQREVDADKVPGLRGMDEDELGNYIKVQNKKYRRSGCFQTESGSYNEEQVWNVKTKDGYRYFLFEPIKWKILNNQYDVRNGTGQMLLMCTSILDYRLYNERDRDRWVDSDLRDWLNQESLGPNYVSNGTVGFYGTAFDANQKKMVLLSDVENKPNPISGQGSGVNTKDYVFIPSIDELTNEQYGFCTSKEKNQYYCENARYVTTSQYAKAMTKYSNPQGKWRLRTSGNGTNDTAYVDNGVVSCKNATKWEEGYGIVPMVKISYKLSDCIRVSFDTNGAGSIEDQILVGTGYPREPITISEGIEVPLELKKEGYVFAGWFTEKECKNKYTFDTALTKDTVLYAGWSKKQDKPTGVRGGIMKIEGTTSNMEYSTSAAENGTWITCKNGSTPVSKAGKWYVRTKATNILYPSDPIEVIVSSIEESTRDYVNKNGVPQSTLAITDKQILNETADKDITGTSFIRIQASAETDGKNKIKLKWNKVEDADGYEIYGAACNKGKKKNKYKLIKEVTNNKTGKYTHKKLKKGTYYKYIVRAYKLIGSHKISIAVSKTIHVTTTGGKYGNAKSVKLKTDKKLVYSKKKKTYNLTLKKKKKYTIKASEVKQSKKIQKHRKIAFECSNPKIATVNGKGIVKGKQKGSCYIYVYTQNGKYNKIKVKVTK